MITRKYFNHPIDNQYGHFDSTGEAKRYEVLLKRQEDGLIRNLRRQVTYELIPRQTKSIVQQMKTRDKVKEVFMEHPVTYVADFVYEKREVLYGYLDAGRKDYGEVGSYWKTIVEDYKGNKYVVTTDFKLKKKIALYNLGIEIQVIYDPNQ